MKGGWPVGGCGMPGNPHRGPNLTLIHSVNRTEHLQCTTTLLSIRPANSNEICSLCSRGTENHVESMASQHLG